MTESRPMLILWTQNSISFKSQHVHIPYHFVHNLEIYDYVEKKNPNLEVDNIDLERSNFDFNAFINRLSARNYAGVALFVSNDNLINSIRLIRIIKEVCEGARTLIYGDLAVLLPDFFCRADYDCFDYIVDRQCDQEIAISDFFNYCAGSGEERAMRGVLKVGSGGLTKLAPGGLVEPGDWGYPSSALFEQSERIVLTVSRGCPYACEFCNAVLYYGTSERRRPVDSILSYIGQHDDKEYKFFAPNFTLNKAWVREFCTALLDRHLHIRWSCTTRADLLRDDEILELMSRSGCKRIAVGVESIIDSDLDAIDKKTDSDTIVQSIRRVKARGMQYKALVMLGIPSQTKENIRITLEALYRLGVQVRATAYTPFYEMNAQLTPEQIERYDKRTYYTGIDGLSYGNFIKLICDTQNYPIYLR